MIVPITITSSHLIKASTPPIYLLYTRNTGETDRNRVLLSN